MWSRCSTMRPSGSAATGWWWTRRAAPASLWTRSCGVWRTWRRNLPSRLGCSRARWAVAITRGTARARPARPRFSFSASAPWSHARPDLSSTRTARRAGADHPGPRRVSLHEDVHRGPQLRADPQHRVDDVLLEPVERGEIDGLLLVVDRRVGLLGEQVVEPGRPLP